MFPFTPPPLPNTLSQDFIERYWDLESRVTALDAQITERLDELERRYKRAEQSERRLDEKRAKETPCPDATPDGAARSVFDIARRVVDGPS